MDPYFTSLFVIVMGAQLRMPTEGMQYLEPLNLEDLETLFDDEGCIDGTLSASESGPPLMMYSVLSAESEHSSTSITREENLSNGFEDKSPMSLVNELAVFNNIRYQYNLIGEEGPPHKKKFLVSLTLGGEHYEAEGRSIKKSQHEAARFALNSTSYEHPPTKPKTDKTFKKSKSTPVQMLSAWTAKHGDPKVSYSFTQQSKLSANHLNNYHKGMYSSVENIHKVTVRVEDQAFTGEGPTLVAAKQDAASKALIQLQNAEGFCMFDESEKSVLARLFNYDSDNLNPVSLIFEFASKIKMAASFDLVGEEGPAHIKRFEFKCSVGEKYETIGVGSSKKMAKIEAAKNMIDKLKAHTLYNPVNCGDLLMKNKKPKKKKQNNLIKSVTKTYVEQEVVNHVFEDEKNPISKLMELQQGKQDALPIFRLMEERGPSKKEFFIEVSVGDLKFVSSGPNKKAAKRKAAEGMLEKLGYTMPSGKVRASSDHKREEFANVKKNQLGPGLNLNSNKFIKKDSIKSNSLIKDKTKDPSLQSTKPKTKSKETSRDSVNKEDGPSSKKQFVQLAKQLEVRFQFSDFPKGNNTGFVSLISLMTDPPKVCYGIGLTANQSQESAALRALQVLYKNQIDLISKVLKHTSDIRAKEEPYLMDKNNIIKSTIIEEKKH